ncbi:hypothetical protein [Acidianus sp. HS-5]|uniref:hypothetical protein n=1 Tax=Acidianus sp. HS-5 TaxID=2886040 RepID=UPI001F302184|nr:hypothetical protein [Acidianus sp. HS-5]BDC18382.1 hypothetical protein HS5_12720 [Acidianus sp. HS-5]
MSYDERTTTEATIEIHFNLYEFRDSISKYTIVSDDDWEIISGKEGKYLTKEFDTYGILIYPIEVSDDIKNSFLNKIEKIDKFREALYKPRYWREFITILIQGDKLFTSSDLGLETFNGVDIVNDIARSKGIQYENVDDYLRISIDITRPLDKDSLNNAMERLSKALLLYYKIKEYQEDIASKLASQMLS